MIPKFNLNFIHDIPSDKESSKPGTFVKRDFVIPNGRGTIIKYSNTWESPNNDTPSFNTMLNPMENSLIKKMQSIAPQNNMIDAMLQRIKSMSEIQKNGNYLSKIQENNNGSTINEQSVEPVDLADNVFNSNTNNIEEPQQKQQGKQEKQYTSNKPTNRQKINTKPTNTSSEESHNLSNKKINEIRNQVLKQSNYYRRKHKLPQLSIDDQVSTPIYIDSDFISKLTTRPISYCRYLYIICW